MRVSLSYKVALLSFGFPLGWFITRSPCVSDYFHFHFISFTVGSYNIDLILI